ncbi:hypothetical protein [Kaarinaea lacus]
MTVKQIFTSVLSTLLASILLFTCNTALSASTETEELRVQQQKLKELLDRIGEAQDKRGKQYATLKKLERQMACNWGLIQDYDDCEKQHANNIEAHLNCKQAAKKKAIDCLSSSAE